MMGYDRHHAIIVTTWDEEKIKKARKIALQKFPAVSEILKSEINAWYSFFIPPDGSKEGWDESKNGDNRRYKFIEWLESQKYEDGSSPFDWVEIQYGDDWGGTIIVRHSDEEGR